MSQTKNKEIVEITSQAIGYAMALRKVISWLKSGETIEQFFETKNPQHDLTWEWNELNNEINQIKKKKKIND